MTRPQRYLTRMIVFLLVVAAIAGLLFPFLKTAFLVNPALNGLIVAVFLFGIGYIFQQVLMLRPEVQWLENFRAGRVQMSNQREPTLLAPMSRMLGDRQGRLVLSGPAMRTLLDGISIRLDETRELSRYLIGLLIFLGLLGTFYGLLKTVTSVGDVIGTLNMTDADAALTFSNLQEGLRQPLTGMGVAFSSSLLGLSGSLVLGFLELQAGQAQNRFYMNLEDWLSGATRLSGGSGLVEGEGSVPAYLQALLEQTAENLDKLQRTVSQSEEGRRSVNTGILTLTERLNAFTDQMRTEQSVLARLAEGQMEMRPVLQRLADAAGSGGFGIDEATRTHLRNLDLYANRILEDLATGRDQLTQDIRSEIKFLARTISALAEDQSR